MICSGSRLENASLAKIPGAGTLIRSPVKVNLSSWAMGTFGVAASAVAVAKGVEVRTTDVGEGGTGVDVAVGKGVAEGSNRVDVAVGKGVAEGGNRVDVAVGKGVMEGGNRVDVAVGKGVAEGGTGVAVAEASRSKLMHWFSRLPETVFP
jgi:hypothetical protein